MIVETVFLSILNQMELNLVQNRKENCHHDRIPFNVKGNGNIVFLVYTVRDVKHNQLKTYKVTVKLYIKFSIYSGDDNRSSL